MLKGSLSTDYTSMQHRQSTVVGRELRVVVSWWSAAIGLCGTKPGLNLINLILC